MHYAFFFFTKEPAARKESKPFGTVCCIGHEYRLKSTWSAPLGRDLTSSQLLPTYCGSNGMRKITAPYVTPITSGKDSVR